MAAQPDCSAENVNMHAHLAGVPCAYGMCKATDVHCFAGGESKGLVTTAAQPRLLQMVQSQPPPQRQPQLQLAMAATAAMTTACCGSVGRGCSRRQAPMRLSRQMFPQRGAGSPPCRRRGTTLDSIPWACTCSRRHCRRQAMAMQLQMVQQRLRQWVHHPRAGCCGSGRSLQQRQHSQQAAVCCGSVTMALQMKRLPSRTGPQHLQESRRQHRAAAAAAAAVTPVSWPVATAAAGARRCPRGRRACPSSPPAACAPPLAGRRVPARCRRTLHCWTTWRMRPPRSRGGRWLL